MEKHTSDVAYSGSVVRQGEMDGLVFATGMNTYFGRTAKLVEKAKTKSHFQKAVIKIGEFLMLPAVLSVTMAVGAIELAKKEAIVSKLAAIDEKKLRFAHLYPLFA